METIEKNHTVRKVLWHLLMLVCVAVYAIGLALICEAAGRQDFDTFLDFIQTDIGKMAMKNTAILAGLLILGLYCLTGKISISMGVVSAVLLILHLINAFKLHFRNEPFYPWDITLAAEATNILSTISLSVSRSMMAAMVYIALALVIALVMDLLVLRKNKPGRGVRLAAFAIVSVYFCVCFTNWFSKDYIRENAGPVRPYNQKASYLESGFIYAFAANYYHARVDAPENYSQSQMEALTGGYEAQTGTVTPNVIIVMSEAFADIWNADNLTFEEALAPTYTALAEQYLSGNCLTSEFGGNTANCEFEVLTGFSTYLLPNGTVPYMSYLNQQTDSYVSFLNSQDYYTLALHPYQRSFFSREKAYELLGFDDYYSEEHFVDVERLRAFKFVSDDAVADRIIAEFEQNQKTDRGFFCHTVTMLNHTSYYASDWAEELQVGMEANCELSQAEYDSIRSYATGLQYADAMLAKLVDYFSQVDEPTVILFFGDHQPSLGSPGYELMQRIGYVRDYTTAEGIAALQSTPYLIWNNFEDTPTHVKTDLSMFQLLPYMTRMLDLDRPGFHSYMDALFAEVRAATRTIRVDAEGNPAFTLNDHAQQTFEDYLTVVYDNLLGKQYSSAQLYSPVP